MVPMDQILYDSWSGEIIWSPGDYNLWSPRTIIFMVPPDYPPARVVKVGLDLIVVFQKRVSWLGTSLLTLVSPFKSGEVI